MIQKRAITVIFVGAMAISSYLLVIQGCRYFPESTFELAGDSRLPKWINLPPGAKRGDVVLSMSYHTVPSGPNVRFTLKDDKDYVIQKIAGRECVNRFSMNEPANQYPAYVAVVVNGTIEIIEHKRMEPVFYVTDNPALSERYKATGCN